MQKHQVPSQMMHHQHVQQLPPACGARQLSKLKRFMTTVQQLASDVSPQAGDHVRHLCLALVNCHISVEEFHAKVQQAINLPMRPFVIPFVKTNLPLLQRELAHCSQVARQFPHLYFIYEGKNCHSGASSQEKARSSPERVNQASTVKHAKVASLEVHLADSEPTGHPPSVSSHPTVSNSEVRGKEDNYSVSN